MKRNKTKSAGQENRSRKIAISGLVIALYIVIMYMTQGFAFGQYQMRIATSLYALAAVYPFLIVPLGLANFLSNTIMGGLGLFDMIGGFGVGILTAYCCWLARKVAVPLTAVPVLLIPSLIVPIWLSVILQVPYWALVLSVGVGQILPAVIGVLLVRFFEKPLLKQIGR